MNGVEHTHQDLADDVQVPFVCRMAQRILMPSLLVQQHAEVLFDESEHVDVTIMSHLDVPVLHRVDIVVVIVNDTSVQKFTQIHNAPDVTSLEGFKTKFVDSILIDNRFSQNDVRPLAVHGNPKIRLRDDDVKNVYW